MPRGAVGRKNGRTAMEISRSQGAPLLGRGSITWVRWLCYVVDSKDTHPTVDPSHTTFHWLLFCLVFYFVFSTGIFLWSSKLQYLLRRVGNHNLQNVFPSSNFNLNTFLILDLANSHLIWHTSSPICARVTPSTTLMNLSSRPMLPRPHIYKIYFDFWFLTLGGLCYRFCPESKRFSFPSREKFPQKKKAQSDLLTYESKRFPNLNVL